METIQVKNWQHWTELMEQKLKIHQRFAARMVLFRGQSNSDWKLFSSLARIINGNETSENKAQFYEKQSVLRYISQAHLLDPHFSIPEEHHTQLLIDMQHYSCPTRLIDWSTSPYVALYFAISENFEKDAALYIYGFDEYQRNVEKAFKDISGLSHLEFLELKEFDAISSIFPVKKNHRIVRQQGAFTISNNFLRPHEDIILEAAEKAKNKHHNGLAKVIIPARLKIEFLARLKTMNIRAESLFPGLDGLGRTIKEDLLIRKWDEV